MLGFKKLKEQLPAISSPLPALPAHFSTFPSQLLTIKARVSANTGLYTTSAVEQATHTGEEMPPIDSKWEDSDFEYLYEEAKYVPLESPEVRKQLDYFGSEDPNNHINMQSRAAVPKSRKKKDKKAHILGIRPQDFQKIHKPVPVPLDPEWEESRDKEDFDDSYKMYSRPSMQQELLDYHGTADPREALRREKARREQKKRDEAAAAQKVRQASYAKELQKSAALAQPLTDSLAKQAKEQEEARCFLVDTMDAVVIHGKMRGDKDIGIALDEESPSYVASIEERGRAGLFAPWQSGIAFPQHQAWNSSPTEPTVEPLKIKNINQISVEGLADLIQGPQVRLVLGPQIDDAADNVYKRLLAAVSPICRDHFNRADVSKDIAFVHLKSINQWTFVLLYRWLYMICRGKWDGGHIIESYDACTPLFPLPELGANLTFETKVNLYCAIDELDIHLPKFQLQDSIRSHFPIPDGPIRLDGPVEPQFLPTSFPADKIRLVFTRLCFDVDIRYHVVRYVAFLRTYRLCKAEISSFATDEKKEVILPLAAAVQNFEKLGKGILDWQLAVPVDLDEMELEECLDVMDSSVGGEVGDYRMEPVAATCRFGWYGAGDWREEGCWRNAEGKRVFIAGDA